MNAPSNRLGLAIGIGILYSLATYPPRSYGRLDALAIRSLVASNKYTGSIVTGIAYSVGEAVRDGSRAVRSGVEQLRETRRAASFAGIAHRAISSGKWKIRLALTELAILSACATMNICLNNALQAGNPASLVQDCRCRA